MNRTFDTFRYHGPRDYGREDRDRDRDRRDAEEEAHGEQRRSYGFVEDRERVMAEEREHYEARRRQEAHPSGSHYPPPTTYGVLPERSQPLEVWRGRNEEYDFWGFERHPHPSLWARVKGVFSGKGPKNYVRSDERIREDVCEHLAYHPYIDASDIDVIVRDGEVTLTGTVDGRMVKRAAEECCEHVHGVQDVHNHLRVKRPDQPSP